MITNIIQIFLGLLGFIALIIIIYGGFVWMTSGGNQEKINKAKGILKSAIIGLLIILFSYVIVSVVMRAVVGVTTDDGGGGTGYTDGDDYTFGDGALGGGVIENHFPERDAINVPRNTMIMITFKVPVAPSTILNDDNPPADCATYNVNGNECGNLRADNIKIKNVNNQILASDRVIAVLQKNGKSVLLKPVDLLGLSTSDVNINVHLTSGILAQNGNSLLSGNGYSWNFTVSTFSDTTPPRVTKVWPKASENSDVKFARNAIIQINFSEPINFLSMDGNITVSSSGSILPGELKISNKYKTVEFLSSGSCSESSTSPTINSCGERVFCLPANSTINGLIYSGNGINPLSGISDAAGNLLDGNSDGQSSGSPHDDYKWSFNTSDTIDLSVPKIILVSPTADKISINPEIYAKFSKDISPSSLTSDNVYIYNSTLCSSEDNNTIGKKDELVLGSTGTACFPNYSVYLKDDGVSASINIYSPYLQKNAIYRPRLTSGVKDTYGNCFYHSHGPSGPGQH